MEWQLDAAEVRVLGALIEKEITTPDLYPLSLNALVNACNQRSNRDPVVAYDEGVVEAALASLRAKGLATRITGADVRVPKHTERLIEKLNLGRREVALLCVLMLRGPQTPGELRGRSERLHTFDDLEAVEHTLDRMAESGLVKKLPRQPGSRESRFAHLLSGDVETAAYAEASASEARPAGPSDRERLAALENEVAEIKRAFEEFRARFE
ncbi:MAG: YceH family protein [Bryobacteraceae bacterium]